MADWKLLTDGFKRLIEKLEDDLSHMEQGDLRVTERTPHGWQDRTAQEIHDKRNLIATVQATLGVIVAMGRS